MAVALGIDLGTSETMAAYSRDGKASQLVKPQDGGGVTHTHVFPSYVEFDAEGKLDAAGARAKARFDGQSGGTVFRHLKRLIGRPYNAVSKLLETDQADRFLREFRGRIARTKEGGIALQVPTSSGDTRKVPVETAVAHLLALVWRDAQKQIAKDREKITHVAITVPAIFSDGQRQATMSAASRVFDHAKILPLVEEPVAAALSYGIEDEATMMVIDIGAGTTDITVGQLSWSGSEPHFRVIYLGGDPNLGGLDMDFAILEHLCNVDDQEPTLRDVLDKLSPLTFGALMSQIEKVKIVASIAGRASIATTIAFEDDGKKFLKVISQDFLIGDLEEICRPITNRCVEEVRKCLAKMAGSEETQHLVETILSLDVVLPVGGPMGFAPLREALAQLFEPHPYAPSFLRQLDPRQDLKHQEAVARGAAMAAARLARPEGRGRRPFAGAVPYDISLFFLGTGGTVVVPSQHPYEEKAVVSMPFHFESGPSRVMILSHVGDSLADATVRYHAITVEKSGNVDVEFVWSTSRLEVHIPELDLHFPTIQEHSTFGHHLNSIWEEFAEAVREAPKIASELPDQLCTHVATRAGVPEHLVRARWGEIERQIPVLGEAKECALELRDQGSSELETAANLPWPEPPLSEEELRAIYERGYFGYRKELAINRGVPPRVYELIEYYFNFPPYGCFLAQLAQYLLSEHGSVGVPATGRVRQALASYRTNPYSSTADASLRQALSQFVAELNAHGAINGEKHTAYQNAIAVVFPG